jgi:hypothetical protein
VDYTSDRAIAIFIITEHPPGVDAGSLYGRGSRGKRIVKVVMEVGESDWSLGGETP